MNKLLVIVILGLAGVGLYNYFKRRDLPAPPGPRISDPPRPGTEAVIDRYFQRLEQDIEQFEISTFYSYQFDLESLKKPYTRTVATISNLSQLGLDPEEVRAGNEILIKRASQILQGHPPDWSTSLVFLMDYSGAKARLSALEKIYDQIQDKPAADNYMKRLRTAREALVARYR